MAKHTLTSIVAGVACLILVGSVAGGQREAALTGITNYTRIDATFACAGTTPVQAIPELKKSGFASIANFRLPEEPRANIEESKAAAATVGIRDIHLPFRTPARELVKRLKVDGWDAERATKEAEALGLRSDALKQFALEYAGRR